MKRLVYLLPVAALFAFSACSKPDDSANTGDAYITVSPTSIPDVPYTASTYKVEIDANCKWTITKTDDEGNPVQWLKTDKLTGEGKATISILVEENPGNVARSGAVNITSDKASASIDITQAANPGGEDPGDDGPQENPGDEPIVLSFDFSGTPLTGWPTETGTGTAECVYSIEGKNYTFVLTADGQATNRFPYWKEGTGIVITKYRYIGLPAIEGYRLTKVVATNAKVADAESKYGKAGVANQVENIAGAPDADGGHGYVKGGEPQVWSELADYTYELGGTTMNTVYYLISLQTYGSFLKAVTLTFEKGDAPADDPGDDPGDNPGGDPGDNPGGDPSDKVLDFDFSGDPLDGWPTAAGEHVDGGKTYIYPIDGEYYTFVLADCDGANQSGAYWQKPYGIAFSIYRYIGLPAFEGYKLTEVVATCGRKRSSTAKVGIAKQIEANQVHPGDEAGHGFVTGGDPQEFLASDTEYTYTLKDTEANKVYYLCNATEANAFAYVKNIKVTYSHVTPE